MCSSAGWTTATLGEVGEWRSGGTPSKGRPDYWDGDVPWVSPKDMKVFSLKDTKDHISQRALSDGARHVQADTIFIVVRGMILAHTFPVCLAERPMAFNQDVKAIVTNASVDGRFLAHWLHGRSEALLRLVTEATHGTKRIDLRDLLAQSISLPPFPEQRRIAEILDTVDEAIRKTEEIITKLEQVKQGLLHDLLTRGIDDNGELRDPDRHPEQFKDSPLGRIPKAWTVDALADVGSWTSGGTPSKAVAAFWNGSIPWVSPKDMKVFRLADTQDRVSEEGVAAGSRLVPTGSVFIVVRGMILAHTFPVCLAGRPMAFNQDVKGIVPRQGLRGEYLAHWFVTNADMMLSIVTEATHGTKRIDLADLHRQFIAVPATREQDAILEVMRIEEARLDHERNELSKFRLLKQGLTEDVLTGRVRVTALLDETPE